MEKLEIYTDGSIKDNFVTTGCFIITEDEKEYWIETRKYEKDKNPFGFEISDSTGAEYLALYQLLKFIKKKKYDIILYTDCLSIFDFLEKKKSKARSKLNKNAIPLLNRLIESYEKEGGKIEFRWVPGHKGVYGNTKADNICSRLQRDMKIKRRKFKIT